MEWKNNRFSILFISVNFSNNIEKWWGVFKWLIKVAFTLLIGYKMDKKGVFKSTSMSDIYKFLAYQYF